MEGFMGVRLMLRNSFLAQGHDAECFKLPVYFNNLIIIGGMNKISASIKGNLRGKADKMSLFIAMGLHPQL